MVCAVNNESSRTALDCVANVGLRKLLNLYKRGFKIYDLVVVFLTARPWAERGSRFTRTFFFFFFSSSLSPDADLTRPTLNQAIFNVHSPNVVEP